MTKQQSRLDQLEEWPEDEPIKPPDGTLIIQPFRELMQFWPNDQWDRDDAVWVQPYEQRFMAPLGNGMANIFGVNLINDEEYIGMPEEAKASFLSCVLTRSQIREVQTGIYEWYPLCVVVRYCIVVGVQVRIDRSNQKIEIPRAMLWSRQQQEYIPVFDQVAGKIENPAVVLRVLDRYAQLEFAPTA